MREVFLSHASPDHVSARRLREVPVAHDMPVWFRPHHIRGAQQWHDEIGAALARCGCFMVLLTPHAVKSMWVQRELKYALSEKRYQGRIIPLLFKKCDFRLLSWTLPQLQMIDFRQDTGRVVGSSCGFGKNALGTACGRSSGSDECLTRIPIGCPRRCLRSCKQAILLSSERGSNEAGIEQPHAQRQPARSDFDSPWKEALDYFLARFLSLFFTQVHAGIDWSKGYEALDKELHQIARRARSRKALADKLFKIWRLNGQEAWLLVHIEVQGEPDDDFPLRMFGYNTRAFDRYNRTVVSLAVLTDDRLICGHWRLAEIRRVASSTKCGLSKGCTSVAGRRRTYGSSFA
jgi:hypothetical protein